MRDQDLVTESIYGGNPYDRFGPYNNDVSAGPSRAVPLPYDDPYSDSYGIDAVEDPHSNPSEAQTAHTMHQDAQTSTAVVNFNGESGHRHSRSPEGYSRDRGVFRGRGRGRGRGSRPDEHNPRNNRGRGRQWDTRRNDFSGARGRDRQITGRSLPNSNHTGPEHQTYVNETHGIHAHRSLSPASQAIARVTRQYANGPNFDTGPAITEADHLQNNHWTYQHHENAFAFGYHEYHSQMQPALHPFMQPHINPRFAAAYGMSVGYGQVPQPGVQAYSGRGWGTSAWTDSIHYEVKKEEE
jgi:H/ACA ribonucleoprotein complex non-core subunit NAF1